MSNVTYTTPKVDIVEFGNEDLVCTVSGWTPDGNMPGFGVTEEDKDNPSKDDEF